MSISRNYYVIAGYDLTGFDNSKFDDWKWTNEGEEWFGYQTKGRIQLFDDPMNGDYLYLGYVLAKLDMYEPEAVKINLNEIKRQEPYVLNKLKQLINKNVINDFDFKYEVIAFEECT